MKSARTTNSLTGWRKGGNRPSVLTFSDSGSRYSDTQNDCFKAASVIDQSV